LLGHLTEMAEGSGLSAVIDFEKVPVITPEIYDYIAQGSVPGGTNRNMDSYGHKIEPMTDQQRAILADPQTSGGLLIAVGKDQAIEVVKVLSENGLADFCEPIGYLTESGKFVVNFS
jgi:selenide,water dikinase